MANAYYDDTRQYGNGASPEQRAADLHHVALCTWAFVRCMKRHLSPTEEDEAEFVKELYEKLPAEQAQKIVKAAHRPNRAIQDLSFAIEELPMHYMRKHEVHQTITIFEDNLGSSERILTSPVPLFYSRHLARFLAAWLLLLPLGLYDTFGKSWNHLAMIPAIVVISTMLFGIEEIGTQLEEPFTVLPMQAFCDKIYNWCVEIQTWMPGDNGRGRRTQDPKHVLYFSEQESAAHEEASLTMMMNAMTPEAVLPPPPPLEQVSPSVPVVEEEPLTSVEAATLEEETSTAPPSSSSSPASLSMEEFLKRQSEGV